jgi:GDPmannose 4,6-dehydratase
VTQEKERSAKALITGITGQDGFYLSELLLKKGYEVWGIKKRSAQQQEVPEGARIIEGDITDAAFIRDAVEQVMPDEFYNLAAMTHVGLSFKIPAACLEINTVGTLNCLEAAKRVGCKFYQASTSELFGDSPPPQNEETPMRPRSPYGVSKLAAHWLTKNYRERGLFAVTGILFNHESPRRGIDFVSRKVCEAAGKGRKVRLGNIEAKRDWGHAEDYVLGMWLMMQQDNPDDYVLATGEAHSVKELCEIAYGMMGLDWRKYVEIDPSLFRPTDVEHLLGDPRKAEGIGWRRRHSFRSLIAEMVNAATRQ